MVSPSPSSHGGIPSSHTMWCTVTEYSTSWDGFFWEKKQGQLGESQVSEKKSTKFRGIYISLNKLKWQIRHINTKESLRNVLFYTDNLENIEKNDMKLK
jgi:hypothetical protein